MASRMLRRSGIAVGLVAEVLGWKADLIVQVGIGVNHQEVDVLNQEWPACRFLGFDPTFDGDGYPGPTIRCAIGSENGKMKFYVKHNHKDGSTFYPDPEHFYKETTVEVFTLDYLVSSYAQLRTSKDILLWIDCEGNELEALKGAQAFLKQENLKVINVEMTANRPNSKWCSAQEVHRAISEAGFMRQWIHTQRISAGQYDAIYVRPELFKAKFCCDPIH